MSTLKEVRQVALAALSLDQDPSPASPSNLSAALKKLAGQKIVYAYSVVTDGHKAIKLKAGELSAEPDDVGVYTVSVSKANDMPGTEPTPQSGEYELPHDSAKYYSVCDVNSYARIVLPAIKAHREASSAAANANAANAAPKGRKGKYMDPSQDITNDDELVVSDFPEVNLSEMKDPTVDPTSENVFLDPDVWQSAFTDRIDVIQAKAYGNVSDSLVTPRTNRRYVKACCELFAISWTPRWKVNCRPRR